MKLYISKNIQVNQKNFTSSFVLSIKTVYNNNITSLKEFTYNTLELRNIAYNDFVKRYKQIYSFTSLNNNNIIFMEN